MNATNSICYIVSKRKHLQSDPNKKRASEQERYPNKKRASERKRYQSDPNKKRAAARERYDSQPEKRKLVQARYSSLSTRIKQAMRNKYSRNPVLKQQASRIVEQGIQRRYVQCGSETVCLLTLGAHAQRGLLYLVCLSVCVCVCVCVSMTILAV